MQAKPQIVWLHGYPCSGKTFFADYLATIGWENVDGDWVSSATDPADIALAKEMEKAFYKVSNGEDLGEADKDILFKYQKDLCDKALKLQSEGKNAAISFVCYTKWLRD